MQLYFYVSKYNNLEFLYGFLIDLELTWRGKTIRDPGWRDKTRFGRRGRSKEVYTCFTIVLPDFSITEAFDASCVRTACKSCFWSWYSHNAHTSSWKQYDFSSICLASSLDSVFNLVLYEIFNFKTIVRFHITLNRRSRMSTVRSTIFD